METRDEIKKRMEESLKGCKIIDKQETPKITILPDLSDPAEYKRWFNMGPKEAMVNLQKYVDLNKKDNINFETEFNYLPLILTMVLLYIQHWCYKSILLPFQILIYLILIF